MFANTASRTDRNAFTSTYRQVGVETGVAGSSPHQLVAMLYDGLQDAIAQARGALHDGRIQDKGRAIGRAVRIVEEGLRAGLNLAAGGELAANLHALYGYIGQRLTHANLHNDMATLDECTRLIEPLRSAWQDIDPRKGASPQ